MQYHSILNIHATAIVILLSASVPQVECQNYIRVLLVNKTEVITCGTNAFQPLCITREVSIYQLNELPNLKLLSKCVCNPYRILLSGREHEQSVGEGERSGPLPI